MSHRLGALSSDYCSVCQNGLLPSAAATASNPLWPLAAPFLMTNCQPAPTKARLKCQHRMTKGPRGSSETNCVQYELILYSRAGACLAAGCSGCWLASERTPRAGPGHRAPVACRPAWGPWARGAAWGGSSATGAVSWEIRGTSRGLSSVGAGWARRVVASPGKWDGDGHAGSSPGAMGSVPDVGGTGAGTMRAARKMPKQASENHSSQRDGCAEHAVGTTRSHVPSLGLCAHGGAMVRGSAAERPFIQNAA